MSTKERKNLFLMEKNDLIYQWTRVGMSQLFTNSEIWLFLAFYSVLVCESALIYTVWPLFFSAYTFNSADTHNFKGFPHFNSAPTYSPCVGILLVGSVPLQWASRGQESVTNVSTERKNKSGESRVLFTRALVQTAQKVSLWFLVIWGCHNNNHNICNAAMSVWDFCIYLRSGNSGVMIYCLILFLAIISLP